MEDSKKSINRSFSSFTIGIFLSRVSGMLRDVFMAFFLGSSPLLALFMIAFRFSNLFRRIFGESSMQAGFIPHFESLRSKDHILAAKFFRDIFFTLFCMLIVFIFIFQGGLYISKYFFITTDMQRIISFTSIMIFGLLFVCLSSLNSSLLQCEKKYFIPAVAPSIFNFVLIITLYIYRNKQPLEIVEKLSFATVIGFFFQWILTSFYGFKYFSTKLNVKNFFRPVVFSEAIKKIIKPIFLGIMGVAALQLNSFTDSVFAKISDPSGPTFLWFAIRLEQLPIALFAIALSGAVFPPLSRAFQRGDIKKYIDFLSHFSKKSISFMFFSTFYTLTFGYLIIVVIYKRGNFDDISTINTLKALYAYIFGLAFHSLVLIMSSSYYAKKNYKIPTKGSFYSVVLNIFLNSIFIFIFKMSFVSIALATSISSMFNIFYLLKKFSYLKIERKYILFILKTVMINIIPFASISIFMHFFYNYPSLNILFEPASKYVFLKNKSFFLVFFELVSYSTIYLLITLILAKLFKENIFLEIFKFINKPTMEKKSV